MSEINQELQSMTRRSFATGGAAALLGGAGLWWIKRAAPDDGIPGRYGKFYSLTSDSVRPTTVQADSLPRLMSRRRRSPSQRANRAAKSHRSGSLASGRAQLRAESVIERSLPSGRFTSCRGTRS